MSDSTFNPDQFLSTTTDQVGETKFYPCPVGDWNAQASKVEAKVIESGPGSQEPGKKFTVLEITWDILDEEPKRQCEQDRVTVRQSIFLDLTPGGGLDFGKNKNVTLSRLREALGQQRSGRQWAPSHITGGTAKVRVVHDPDKTTGDPRARVSMVAGS